MIALVIRNGKTLLNGASTLHLAAQDAAVPPQQLRGDRGGAAGQCASTPGGSAGMRYRARVKRVLCRFHPKMPSHFGARASSLSGSSNSGMILAFPLRKNTAGHSIPFSGCFQKRFVTAKYGPGAGSGPPNSGGLGKAMSWHCQACNVYGGGLDAKGATLRTIDCDSSRARAASVPGPLRRRDCHPGAEMLKYYYCRRGRHVRQRNGISCMIASCFTESDDAMTSRGCWKFANSA